MLLRLNYSSYLVEKDFFVVSGYFAGWGRIEKKKRCFLLLTQQFGNNSFDVEEWTNQERKAFLFRKQGVHFLTQ